LPDLAGKVAVITGALGLLGRAHCEAFAQAGASVVATDLDHTACEALAQSLVPAAGAGALGWGADVTSKASLERLRTAILDRFGRIDVLLNNAAINDAFDEHAGAESSKFENYPLDLFQLAMDVNVSGTFLACRILGADMAARGTGSIINVASTYGLVGPDQSMYRRPDGSQRFFKSPSYVASKGAVVAFTKYLAAYWGSQRVRVNCLCPGGVFAEQEPHFVSSYSARTPLGRMAEAGEIAQAAVFLAGDASSYMTGSNLVVDGGWTAW
jgi:NAD(P)-dependent dehydrogenase (short-subunit alcohol dehydrogenase family)